MPGYFFSFLIMLIGIVYAVAIACALWAVLKIFLALKEGAEEGKKARLKFQAMIQQMPEPELRAVFLNHVYFTGLMDTKVVRELFVKVIEQRDFIFLKSLNEAGLYRLLASAEREAGRQGRPEACDYSAEIWDILHELARKYELLCQ